MGVRFCQSPADAGIHRPPSFRRRPESIFVIPAKAGIHFDFALWFSALSRRPTHVRVWIVGHPWPPVTSLCLSKEKVTKEKTPSRPRSRAHPCPRDYASRLRGSPGAHPCALVELAGILPAIAVATDPAPARRGREGPGKSESAAVPAAEAVRTVRRASTHPLSRSRERARVRAGSWVPSEKRRRANGTAACTARGRRDGSRRFGQQAMDGLWAEPVRPQRTLAVGEGADPRVPFSLVTFFWASKEKVTGRHGWRTKRHTDVSRSSRQRRRPKRKTQIKMDSGLRRNDGDDWIPAFARMTRK